MVDSIKTPLDQRHLHVNDNSRHDTFTRNNAYVCARRPTSVRFLLMESNPSNLRIFLAPLDRFLYAGRRKR